MKNLTTTTVFVATLGLLVVIPAVIFLASALYHGMGVAASISALADQYTVSRTNLVAITLLGLLPVLVVGLLLGARRLLTKTWQRSEAYALGGVIPILAVTVFVHLEYWPSYLPSRQFMGFPHGLEFVIGPLVFAPIGVTAGFVVVWLLGKRT